MLVGVVDQRRYLLTANFRRSIAEDKEQGVDDVALTTAIGSDYGGESLCDNSDIPAPTLESKHADAL